MPNYEYACPVCETYEERNVPMEDREDQECDKGHALKRLWSFTGSVWAPTSSSGASHK